MTQSTLETLASHAIARPNLATGGPTPSRALRIRPASLAEMPAIADLVRSSADWYRPIVDDKDMTEHDVGPAWAEKNFRRRDFYLGLVDDEPVGTLSLQYFGSHAYLGYIYLDIEHVGQGHGQTLMRFAERVARERGMADMVLIAHPEASWAKRAYLKYGFEIIETDRERVLAWEGGALVPYYEEGFELYRYALDIRGSEVPS